MSGHRAAVERPCTVLQATVLGFWNGSPHSSCPTKTVPKRISRPIFFPLRTKCLPQKNNQITFHFITFRYFRRSFIPVSSHERQAVYATCLSSYSVPLQAMDNVIRQCICTGHIVSHLDSWHYIWENCRQTDETIDIHPPFLNSRNKCHLLISRKIILQRKSHLFL